MRVIIAENYQDGAAKAADIIEKIVRDNPNCTLGLATGSSPVGMYQELARRCREEGLDFSHVHSGDHRGLSISIYTSSSKSFLYFKIDW